MDLKGKKLLVLGGNALSGDIVRTAQSMGIYVIVTDWNTPDKSPAKLIADEAWKISLSDTKVLAEKIKEDGVDGVITGFTDSYLQYYYDLCQAAGLPCYGAPHQFGIATDKLLFKEACRRAGAKTVPGGCVSNLDEARKMAAEIGCPLIFKPADNSGSRGVIKCESQEDVESAYEYALSFSPSKKVICEKFMQCECVGISYQLCEGEATLAMLGDKHSFAEGSFSTSPGSTYPSRYLDRFLKEADGPIKQFFKNEGFRNGIASFEAFVDADGFYLVEMCYRTSGGQHYIMIDDATGVDGLKLLIEYAITGKLSDYDKSRLSPRYDCLYARINIPGKGGATIAKISGVEELASRENVIKIIQKHYERETIGAQGTSAQMLFAIFCKCKDKAELKEFMGHVKETLKVEDEQGESLLALDGLEALWQ